MARGVGRFGYPSNKQLQRQAMRLANASLPSQRSVARPFNQGIGDVRGFTTALLSLLRSGPRAGAAYDDPIASQQQADTAAQSRLGELGPEYAGAAVAAGSQGRSSLSRLLEGKATAGAYSAKQPGIAGARGALATTGLANARTEALRERGEALRPAFMQALDQVRNNALALSMANFQIDQADQDKALNWFNAQTARMGASSGGGGGGVDFDDLQQIRSAMSDRADNLFGRTKKVRNPNYDPVLGTGDEFIERPNRPTWGRAFRQVRSSAGQELRALGYSNREIDKIVRQILKGSGFKPPKPRGGPGVPKGGPGGTPGGGPPE